MASITTPSQEVMRSEGLLTHLPMSKTTEHGKGEMIYGPDRLSESIYVVICGKVGISQIAEDGSEVLLEIVRPDELFGESALVDVSRGTEKATVIERATLMNWPISDLEELVMKRPRLAVALLQVLAQRNAEFSRRIESFALDTVERRLARSLIRLSERLGSLEDDGSVRMIPFTHETLSRYVGTTREIITQCMTRFRKKGYVSYSRKAIYLHRDDLRTVLKRRERLLTDTSN